MKKATPLQQAFTSELRLCLSNRRDGNHDNNNNNNNDNNKSNIKGAPKPVVANLPTDDADGRKNTNDNRTTSTTTNKNTTNNDKNKNNNSGNDNANTSAKTPPLTSPKPARPLSFSHQQRATAAVTIARPLSLPVDSQLAIPSVTKTPPPPPPKPTRPSSVPFLQSALGAVGTSAAPETAPTCTPPHPSPSLTILRSNNDTANTARRYESESYTNHSFEIVSSQKFDDRREQQATMATVAAEAVAVSSPSPQLPPRRLYPSIYNPSVSLDGGNGQQAPMATVAAEAVPTSSPPPQLPPPLYASIGDIIVSLNGGNNQEAPTATAPTPTAPPPQLPNRPHTPAIRLYSDVSFTDVPWHASLKGSNIGILGGMGRVAVRTESKVSNSLVFSSRNLRCGETIVIQVMNASRSFSDGLGLGLTSCNPNDVEPASLPSDPYLLLDRSEYWVIYKDVCTFPEIGDELSFHLAFDGAVKYSRNKNPQVTLMHLDNTLPLWIFFDVNGNAQKIKALGCTMTPILYTFQDALQDTLQDALEDTIQNTTPGTVQDTNGEFKIIYIRLEKMRDTLRDLNTTRLASERIWMQTVGIALQNYMQYMLPDLCTLQSLRLETMGNTLRVTMRELLKDIHTELHSIRDLTGDIGLDITRDTVREMLEELVSSLEMQVYDHNIYASLLSPSAPPTETEDDDSPHQPLDEESHPNQTHAQPPAPANTSDDSDEDCHVCYDEKVNCVLYKCGHMCLCLSCAEQVMLHQGRCPMCRNTITDIIKVFRS